MDGRACWVCCNAALLVGASYSPATSAQAEARAAEGKPLAGSDERERHQPVAAPSPEPGPSSRKLQIEVFASTGLLLMDTAYTRPLAGSGGDLDVDDRQIGGFGFNVGMALRRHYAPHLGLQARLSGGRHWMSANYGDGPSQELGGLTNVSVDFTHLFGPFGRYTVGPNLLLSWMTFSRGAVLVPTESEVMVRTRLPSGFSVGPGVDMGLYVGRNDEVNLNLRWSVSKQFNAPEPNEGGDLILRFELGAGYAF